MAILTRYSGANLPTSPCLGLHWPQHGASLTQPKHRRKGGKHVQLYHTKGDRHTQRHAKSADNLKIVVGMHYVNPPLLVNKHRAQTKNHPKNKSHLGPCTECAKDNNHVAP